MSARTEVAVVGAGVVGLAAAVALRDAGADVMCFEAGEPGGGQSAGETRVFRHRHDSDEMVALAAEAREGWREWEARAGRRLVGEEGVLRFGDDVHDAHRRLRAAGVAAELVDAARQGEVLRGLVSPADAALFEPAGGAIRARRTIEVLAGWLGDRLVRAHVFGLRREPGALTVVTSEGPCRCERAVLCAGVNTPALAAPLGIDFDVRPAIHARVTFAMRDPTARLACLQDGSGAHGEVVYGAPCGTTGRYVVGLVGEDADVEDPGDVDTRVARTRVYVERALRALDPEPVGVRICHTTKLAAGKDAFEIRHADDVVAIAGNNLFKFAPVLGRALMPSPPLATPGTSPPRTRTS